MATIRYVGSQNKKSGLEARSQN